MMARIKKGVLEMTMSYILTCGILAKKRKTIHRSIIELIFHTYYFLIYAYIVELRTFVNKIIPT